MKQRIRLTETDLHRIIKESVREVLNEGSYNNEGLEQWEHVKETIGAENMLNCIWNYLDDTQIKDIIECFKQDDILPSEDDDYEFDEDENEY